MNVEERNMRTPVIENVFGETMDFDEMMDQVFETLNYYFDKFNGMSVEEEKEVLEYMERFYPKIDLVDYFRCWMKLNSDCLPMVVR